MQNRSSSILYLHYIKAKKLNDMHCSLRNFLITVLALLISVPFITNAQSYDEITDVDIESPPKDTSRVHMPDSTILTIVEEMPEYPGGTDSLLRYIGANYNYPLIAVENDIQGKIYVTFVIGPSGKVKDIKVVKGLCTPCDREAIRVVSSMQKWKPGYQRGKAVNVQFTLPITLKLN